MIIGPGGYLTERSPPTPPTLLLSISLVTWLVRRHPLQLYLPRRQPPPHLIHPLFNNVQCFPRRVSSRRLSQWLSHTYPRSPKGTAPAAVGKSCRPRRACTGDFYFSQLLQFLYIGYGFWVPRETSVRGIVWSHSRQAPHGPPITPTKQPTELGSQEILGKS